jgi:hypothetical protein
VQLELTTNQPGRRRVARAALIVAAWSAMLGLGAVGIAGAQDTDPAATQPATTVADAQAPADQTVPPDAIADDGNSAPTPDDAAQGDEKLLNLIIIGLLVLAAVIAVATLLFWKSTAPEDDEGSDADADADGDEADFDDAEPDDEPARPDVPASGPAPMAAVRPSDAQLPDDPAAPPAQPAPGRRVMASFPSSPLGEPGHPASGSSPVPPKDPPPAPVDAADPLGEHISTLGSGASPGRPEVPPPDAVPPTPQGRGAYQVPAPEDLPPQPDRPFADAENRPHVERAVEREPTKARRVPQPPQPVEDSAIVTTSAPKRPPASGDGPGEDEPQVVVRRRRRDRPAGPWGEGVGGGHRPDVPPLPPPDPEDQGYQRGVRVVRPEEPGGDES